MKSKEDRYKNEEDFHNDRFKDEDTRKLLDKYYVITDEVDRYIDSLIEPICKNKKLLDYGCSLGEESFPWAQKGAIVTGIDISPEAIKKAKIDANIKNLNIDFFLE